MWGLVAGAVSYPAFAWYSRRFLDAQGLERGFTRMILVFLVATLLSSALGYGVSWMTSTPQSRDRQAQLQETSMAVLNHCLRNPAGAACQSAAQRSKLLEQKLLSGLTAS